METHTPGIVYKLGPGTDPMGPIGLMMKAPTVQTNAGRMSATVTWSKEAEDRSGDIVVIKGIRLDGHRKNPVTLLNHNRDHVVGYCQDKLGAYTVKSTADRLTGEVFFCQGSQLGHDTFRAVEANILRGTSIGFLPVMGQIQKRNQRGTIYHATNLVETTITPIGDNEDALIEAVHKTFGKQPPVPELAALLPSLNHRPTMVNGWTPGGVSIVVNGAPVPAEAVEKKYTNADPKEAEPQYRNPTYYKCPHCGDEMTPENIFRDGDHTRHGTCRGRVVMKPVSGGEGTLAVGTHPDMPKPEALAMNMMAQPKSLAAVITKRLNLLRRKAMQTRTRPGTADEFAPPMNDAPTAVDQTANPDDPLLDADHPENAPGPHDDHRAVVTEAVGNTLASIFDKFATHQIDRKTAHKLFDKCLRHHDDVSELVSSDDEDPDAPLDLDDEPDPEDMDEDAEGEDDETDDEDTGDFMAKPKKAKAKFYREYTPPMETWITKSYRTFATILDKLDADSPISSTKLRRVCEDQIDKAADLEPVVKAIDAGTLIVKARSTSETWMEAVAAQLPPAPDAWAEEVAAELARRNGSVQP